MKTLRYRIRVITLALVCALLAVVLWTVRSAWFPAGFSSETPAESVSPGISGTPSPGESASPDIQDPWDDAPIITTAPPSVETSSPDPLFNTFGL